VTLLWQDAVQQYLDSLYDPVKPDEATNRPATRKDYKSKLGVPELLVFKGRAISTITREEIAEANAKTCKRAYDMGCGSLRTLKAFWTWLRDPVRSRTTGVTVSIADLRAPAAPRKDAGAPGHVFDAAIEARGKAPPEIMLGRVLAISRAGVLPERISLGVQLLLSSVQRRRQVVGASGRRIVTYDETPDERAWFVPPYFRKTRKGGSRSHLVPVLGFGATAIDALAKRVHEDGREWLFPTREANSDKPADEGILNKWFGAMPGVECSTHGGRYAFSTYGPRDLGFARSEAKIILDHIEGIEPDDVTGRFYSADPAVGRKRQMMEKWIAWLEHWCAEAIRKDGILTDSEALAKVIFKSRYGDERLTQKALP
jgi:glutathione S-transferase